MLGSALLGPRSSVSRWVLGVPCHEIRDTPGPASPHVSIPLFSSSIAVYGLAPPALPRPGCRATLAGRRPRLWQRSAASVCRDPKPSGWGGLPAGVGDAKPSPSAPAGPVLRGRGAHFLRERWDRTWHTPQRPPWERGDPHRAPRLGAKRSGRRVRCARAPAEGGGALVAILARPAGASTRWSWERSPRAGEPQHPGAGATQLHRPCSGLRRFRGRGACAQQDSYSASAKPTSRHLPAGREGEAGTPLLPRPERGPPRPGRPRAVRPAPPARKEPVGRLRPQLSQAR